MSGKYGFGGGIELPKIDSPKLRAVPDAPGSYTTDLIPTQPGDYSFHLTGTIGDATIDETFDSSKGEFSTVEPITDIQFP